MTEARHSRWADWIFRPYLRRIMARSFHDVRLLGRPPDLPRDVPLVVVGNHGTWWDGFFVYVLNKEVLHRRLYVMMLEDQLRKYPFFRRIGAFGISQGKAGGVRAALSYSSDLLREPSHCLCMFPQGTMHRLHDRPLGFRRGLATILALYGGEVCLLPLAIACEFQGERRPETFLLADRAFRLEGAAFRGMDWLESEQAAQMDRLDEMIAVKEIGTSLVRGKKPGSTGRKA